MAVSSAERIRRAAHTLNSVLENACMCADGHVSMRGRFPKALVRGGRRL
jgi:hypothetical protein